MDTFVLPQRPPTQDEIDAMKLYTETGCVTQEYMRKTLGSPMQGITMWEPLKTSKD